MIVLCRKVILDRLSVRRSLHLVPRQLAFTLFELLTNRAEMVSPSLVPDRLRYDHRSLWLLNW